MIDKIRRVTDLIRYGTMRLDALETELDALRSKLDVPDALVSQFHADRQTDHYQNAYHDPEPLVTVCIGTFNRARLLTTRSIPSVLNQTYSHLEVLVVGDHCTDDTAERVAQMGDPRLSFVNLSERGSYPSDPYLRWMVAGTVPFNTALGMAKGTFITHLDDDDAYVPHRIETLVRSIQSSRSDLAFHPFLSEGSDGKWRLQKSEQLSRGHVTTSSILYHNWFRRIPWDMQAYRYREPGDWNRLRKLVYLGALTQHVNEPLLRHYAERRQAS